MEWFSMAICRNLFLFIISFSVSVAACDYETECKYACKYDGDEKSVVIDGECYCANKRPLDRKFLVLKPLKGKAIIKPEPNYWNGDGR